MSGHFNVTSTSTLVQKDIFSGDPVSFIRLLKWSKSLLETLRERKRRREARSGHEVRREVMGGKNSPKKNWRRSARLSQHGYKDRRCTVFLHYKLQFLSVCVQAYKDIMSSMKTGCNLQPLAPESGDGGIPHKGRKRKQETNFTNICLTLDSEVGLKARRINWGMIHNLMRL